MKYKIKCSQCSKDKFVKMPFNIPYFDPDGYACKKLTTSPDNIEAYLCLNCGHIELFSDRPNSDLVEIKKIQDRLSELLAKIPSGERRPGDYLLSFDDLVEHHNTLSDMYKNLQDLANEEKAAKALSLAYGTVTVTAGLSHCNIYTEKEVKEILQLEKDLCQKYIDYAKLLYSDD